MVRSVSVSLLLWRGTSGCPPWGCAGGGRGIRGPPDRAGTFGGAGLPGFENVEADGLTVSVVASHIERAEGSIAGEVAGQSPAPSAKFSALLCSL
jgi:hypothetical protein